MTFTYTLRLKMDGAFPGAPDYDEWVIEEIDYKIIKEAYNALKLRKLSDSDPLRDKCPDCAEYRDYCANKRESGE